MAVQISGNDITVPRDGTFSRNVSIAGTLTYEDVTNIDSVGLITARQGIEVGASPGVAASISVDGNMIVSGITTFGDNIHAQGKIGINTDDPTARLEIIDSKVRTWDPTSQTELLVERNGNCLLSIVGGTSSNTVVNFGDADDENVGNIDYDHADNSMTFRTNTGERLRIGSSGQLGIAGENYGTSGQFLQSQGSGSVIQWASAPTWTQQSISTVQSGTEHEMTGIPSSAKEVMIQFNGISGSGSGQLMFVLGNSGGYSTSGYNISAGYHPNENYVKRTDSIKFHGVNSDNYFVTGRIHLWYPVHSNEWWCEGNAFPDENEGQYKHHVYGRANSGGTLTKIKMTLDNSASFDNTGNGKVQLSYLTY